MIAQLLYSAEFVANKHKGKQMIEKNWMELQKPDQIGVKASEYNPVKLLFQLARWSVVLE